MDQSPSYHRVDAKPWRSRRWRGHWLCCFGPECGPEDCAGCCLVMGCPGVSYSWNASKVLHLSFWRELAKYVAVFALGAILYFGFAAGRTLACDPDVTFDPNSAQVSFQGPKNPAACTTLSVLEPIAWLLFVAGNLFWALFIGGANRRRMRLELGIPITREGCCCSPCHNNSTYCNDDCCLHFWCMSCALCQENRTVLHEEAVGSIQPRLVDGGYSSGLVVDGLPLLDPPAVFEADAHLIKPSAGIVKQMQLPV